MGFEFNTMNVWIRLESHISRIHSDILFGVRIYEQEAIVVKNARVDTLGNKF